MSSLLARILLAIMMFPLAAMIYFSSVILLNSYISSNFAFLWSFIIVAFFTGCYWLSVWRNNVNWTTTRKLGTLFSAFVSLIIGVILGIATTSLYKYGRDETLIIFVGGNFAILIWLVATILIWKETSTERADRVRQSAGDVLFCLKCGYNMTGLYESRCPECGTQYTLDQLLAGQRSETIEDSAKQEEYSDTSSQSD